MSKKIVQRENPILYRKARALPRADFGGRELARAIREMRAALAECKDGVALAAPQIGVSLRIFVVAGKFFETEDMVFINPVIIRRSRVKKLLEEGCLSVRWLYGKVSRAEKVTLEAFTPEGKLVTRGASGLLAQVFQHEVDHLDGILFTDHAKELREVLPEAQSNNDQK